MTRRILVVLLSVAAVGAASPATAPGRPAAVTLVVAPTGNTVRYRVREQLVGIDLPNDAIGETQAVSGSVALDQSGAVIPAESRISVDVAGLRSDKERRDGYLRGRTLETARFPTVDLVVSRIRGVSLPLPTSGTRSLELEGTLTIKGVSRPTTWTVAATFSASTITGKAATKFTFTDFGIPQPRVPVVLSVADTIGLEYDFTFLREDDPD